MSQPEGKKTAVGYVRVSSDEQVDGLSLASQEQKIREWCQLKGYTLLTVFSDEGESAYNDDISKRPQFAALLSRLAAWHILRGPWPVLANARRRLSDRQTRQACCPAQGVERACPGIGKR